MVSKKMSKKVSTHPRLIFAIHPRFPLDRVLFPRILLLYGPIRGFFLIKNGQVETVPIISLLLLPPSLSPSPPFLFLRSEDVKEQGESPKKISHTHAGGGGLAAEPPELFFGAQKFFFARNRGKIEEKSTQSDGF